MKTMIDAQNQAMKIQNHTESIITTRFNRQMQLERFKVEMAKAWLDVAKKQIEVAHAADELAAARHARRIQMRMIDESFDRRKKLYREEQLHYQYLHRAKRLLIGDAIEDKHIVSSWNALGRLLERYGMAAMIGVSSIFLEPEDYTPENFSPRIEPERSFSSVLPLWAWCKENRIIVEPGTKLFWKLLETFQAVAESSEEYIKKLDQAIVEAQAGLLEARKQFIQLNA